MKQKGKRMSVNSNRNKKQIRKKDKWVHDSMLTILSYCLKIDSLISLTGQTLNMVWILKCYEQTTSYSNGYIFRTVLLFCHWKARIRFRFTLLFSYIKRTYPKALPITITCIYYMYILYVYTTSEFYWLIIFKIINNL